MSVADFLSCFFAAAMILPGESVGRAREGESKLRPGL
jgi:hypothetical protein